MLLRLIICSITRIATLDLLMFRHTIKYIDYWVTLGSVLTAYPISFLFPIQGSITTKFNPRQDDY